VQQTGTAVDCWMVKSHTHWAQKLPDEHIESALDNPSFYEYWVVGADAYLNAKLSAELGLVNVQGPFQCHSLTLASQEEEQYLQQAMNYALPGDIITLRDPPLSVNLTAK